MVLLVRVVENLGGPVRVLSSVPADDWTFQRERARPSERTSGGKSVFAFLREAGEVLFGQVRVSDLGGPSHYFPSLISEPPENGVYAGWVD